MIWPLVGFKKWHKDARDGKQAEAHYPENSSGDVGRDECGTGREGLPIFIPYTHEIETEKKRKFVKEYIESNQEDGIDALLSVIDQLDNQHKVEIMARLLKSRVEEEITIYEFNRLVACLRRIPYSLRWQGTGH